MVRINKHNKRSIIICLLLIVVLLFSVVSLSYSWFLYQQPNKTQVFDVNVENSYNLKISAPIVWGAIVDEEWHRTFKLKPVTGDGENFFLPVYEKQEVLDGSGVYDKLPSQSKFERIDETELPNYMYRLDFTLSVEGFVDLYFDFTDNKTYVRPASDSSDGKYGYSPDNVCSAVRLAIIQEGEIKCIWIPNTTTELKIENGDRVLKDGTCESRYIFRHENDGAIASKANSDIILTSYKPQGSYTDPESGIVYIWGDITEENCPQISQLKPGVNNMNILVWLEGTDRECDISMSEGRIDANVCFAIESGLVAE
jgi:hypothetical protein